MLALYIILGIMGYITVAGFVRTKMLGLCVSNCTSDHGFYDSHSASCGRPGAHHSRGDGILSGIFWPLVLPFATGELLADSAKRKENKALASEAAAEQRIRQANLERKAIEQENQNLTNSIRNLELEAGIKQK